MRRFLLLGVLILFSIVASAEASEYLTLEWSFDARDSSKHVYILNVDEDSSLEVIADAERAGLVFAIDHAGVQVWRSNIPGVVLDIHARDFESNTNEIIVGTTPRAYSIAPDGSYNWKYFTNHERVASVYLTDVDGDGSGEALLSVSAAKGFRGNKLLLVEEDGSRTLQIPFKSGDYPNIARSADINGDGVNEIIAGFAVYSVNTIAESLELGYLRDSSVRAFNLNGEQLWSYTTSGGVKSLATVDLNDDGVSEVVVGSRGLVYALSGDGSLLWTYSTNLLVNDILVKDVDGDGRVDVVAVTDTVHVIAANGSRMAKSSKIGQIASVDAADFDGDGKMEVVAASGGVHLFSHDGEKLWNTDGVRHVNSVAAADLDGDGFLEVASASGDSQIRLYSSKPYLGKRMAERLFSDATVYFEAGDLELARKKAAESKLLYEGIIYLEGIDKVNILIEDINSRDQADVLLTLARSKYENKSFDQAMKDAQNAREIYSGLGISNAIRGADELISEIRTLPKARGNLSAAKELLDSKKYLEAHESAQKAVSLFEWLEDDENAAAAAQIVEKTTPYATAASHLVNASSFFDDGFYSNALTEVENARHYYKSLEYKAGLNAARTLERQIRYNRLKENRVFWMEMVLLPPLTILSLILAIAAYVVKRKRGKHTSESHLKRAAEEAEKLL